MKIIHLAIALFVTIIAAGCDYTNDMLTVKNASKQKISVLYANGEKEDENNLAFYTSENWIIYPDSLKAISKAGRQNAWHEYINSGTQKKLVIYIFSVDSLRQYDSLQNMAELISAKKYLEEKSFTEDDLIKNNWTITYRH